MDSEDSEIKQQLGNAEKPPKNPNSKAADESEFEEAEDDDFKGSQNKYENVSVQAAETVQNMKQPGKKITKKKHFCAFCDIQTEQIIRHIEVKHKEEAEVKSLSKCEKNSQERARQTKLLKHRGNFKHNIQVLKENEGILIVVRRPTEKEDASKFVPCASCYGFYSKCELYRHACPVETEKRTEGHMLRESRMVLASALDPVSPILAEVLSHMADDEISQVAKQDSLILKMMHILLEKHDSKQQHHTRQKARAITRLLIHVRNHHQELAEIDMKQLLVPERFDIIIESVTDLCQDIPSLPLKLGQIIPKLVSILIGEAIRRGDTDLEDKCKRFNKLFEGEWADRVSLKNRKRLHDRKLNKKLVMPSSEDVTKFCDRLEADSNKRHEEFKKEPGIVKGRKLAEAVLAEIIAFNMRRGGEASRIELKTYVDEAATWVNRDFNNEMYCSLNENQKANAQLHFLVKIIGKCGTHVPVLLTYKMKEKVDTLVEKRDQLGIPKNNIYLFGIPGYNTHLKAWDVIRKFCEVYQVTNLTSTSLRKYLATSCQALNFSDKDVGHLARHLGHTKAVHERHYRQHLDVIEIGKIATILHACQRGVLHKQREATLDTMETVDWDLRDEPVDDLQSDGSNEEMPVEPVPTTSGGNERPKRCKRKPRVLFRKPTSEERKQILEYFKSLIEARKLPREKECKGFVRQFSSELEWQQVKGVVHSKLQCLKKARGKATD